MSPKTLLSRGACTPHGPPAPHSAQGGQASRWEGGSLRVQPTSVTCQLWDLGQVLTVFFAPVSSSDRDVNSADFIGLLGGVNELL